MQDDKEGKMSRVQNACRDGGASRRSNCLLIMTSLSLICKGAGVKRVGFEFYKLYPAVSAGTEDGGPPVE